MIITSMVALDIIKRHYKENSDLYNILVMHSNDVMHKALSIATSHPELDVDYEFLTQAALLHDIGIKYTYAPKIGCNGFMPYICHGYLGRDILEKEGFPKHALVCERHTGVGLTINDIKNENLPLPLRDMSPVSIEEQIICFADCFYSKTRLGQEKSVEDVRNEIGKYKKENALDIFDGWCDVFL